jgi:hypothetical protein
MMRKDDANHSDKIPNPKTQIPNKFQRRIAGQSAPFGISSF